MKIALLGYSGSGKSTLAAFLGSEKSIPVLHLDTVQFVEHWEERDSEEALEIVEDFMGKSSWVIDGNYTKFYQERRLAEADQIILLMFSPWASLKRVIGRRIKYHHKTRPDMASGCDEKLDKEFLWWVLYEGRRKDRHQHFLDIQKRYPEKTFLIKNQKQLDQFYKENKR